MVQVKLGQVEERQVKFGQVQLGQVKSGPGWDKIFYFVGAITFSQRFHPKQQESDTTEGIQNSGNLGIRYVFLSNSRLSLKSKS